MELNKNSKWLKFYMNFNLNRPTNFCDYFWGSLKSIMITLFFVISLIIILSSLLSPILLFWKEYDNSSVLSGFQVSGIILWICAITIFIMYKLIEYLENTDYFDKPKKDSIIKTWYKDFKNKHCTLITWKDEK